MIAIDRRLLDEHPKTLFILTVHDELVFEVPAAQADAIGDLVRNEMEGVESLKVPLVVDIGVGRSWYDAKS